MPGSFTRLSFNRSEIRRRTPGVLAFLRLDAVSRGSYPALKDGAYDDPRKRVEGTPKNRAGEDMNHLTGLDESLFHLLNGVWTMPLLDALMPALSRAGSLGALWLLLLGAIVAFGKKTGRRIALAGLLALAIGFASSELIKDLTVRPRPFLVLDHVRLLVSAPHSYALPSGHATSSFAAASGAALAAKKLLQRVPVWGWAMFLLAAAIAYSRIYVGVHWPTDVAAGMLLGLASGWLGARLALRCWKRKAVKGTAKETEGAAAVPEVEWLHK
jgi:undecaprenyl-diphosphatase